MAKRGLGFSDAETNAMLNLIEKHLPLSTDEWDYIAGLHCVAFPSAKRNSESLKRRFNKLCRKGPPTGDPYCSPLVRKAKRLRRMLTQEADIVCGENAAELANSVFESETMGTDNSFILHNQTPCSDSQNDITYNNESHGNANHDDSIHIEGARHVSIQTEGSQCDVLQLEGSQHDSTTNDVLQDDISSLDSSASAFARRHYSKNRLKHYKEERNTYLKSLIKSTTEHMESEKRDREESRKTQEALLLSVVETNKKIAEAMLALVESIKNQK